MHIACNVKNLPSFFILPSKYFTNSSNHFLPFPYCIKSCCQYKILSTDTMFKTFHILPQANTLDYQPPASYLYHYMSTEVELLSIMQLFSLQDNAKLLQSKE